jgi:hypothetical protein
MTRTNPQAWGKVATPAVATSAVTIPQRRRWLRFSLRSLLILITVLSIWLGVKVNQARRQKEAVAALSALGAEAYYDHQWHDGLPNPFAEESDPRIPVWLLELAGPDFFQTVVAVQTTRRVTDDDLIHLAGLPKINWLNLNNAGRSVTDVGLAHLPRPDRLACLQAGRTAVGDELAKRLSTAEQLHTLGLGGTRITDEGLRALSALSALQNLSVDNTEVTDAGLDALRQMPGLISLQLDSTQITDAGLAKLSGHRSLTTVQLNHTAVTDAGLKHLATLPRLKQVQIGGTQVRGSGLVTIAARLNVLVLRGTPIDDASLVYLRGANNLEALDLEDTAITDAGLEHLLGLPKLGAICLEGTKVTKEGIAKLTKALPGIAIVTAP